MKIERIQIETEFCKRFREFSSLAERIEKGAKERKKDKGLTRGSRCPGKGLGGEMWGTRGREVGIPDSVVLSQSSDANSNRTVDKR